MPAGDGGPPPGQFRKALSVENQITWSDYIAPASFEAEVLASISLLHGASFIPSRIDDGIMKTQDGYCHTSAVGFSTLVQVTMQFEPDGRLGNRKYDRRL